MPSVWLDAKYKAQHEERKRIPISLGSFRERFTALATWALDKVDMDFRAACIKESGSQFLIVRSLAWPPGAARANH